MMESCILIIDDDKELCALLKKSVETENIEAHTYYAGRERLELLRANEYQLITKTC